MFTSRQQRAHEAFSHYEKSPCWTRVGPVLSGGTFFTLQHLNTALTRVEHSTRVETNPAQEVG